MEVQARQIDTGIAKSVQIALANMTPIVELDAELERAAGFANKLVFIEAENAIQAADLRDGRFADTNRTNRFRFNQRDVHGRAEQPIHGGGGNPPTMTTDSMC